MQHHLHTLKNGTRTIFVPHKDSISVTIFVFYGVGSRYEPAKIWGSSHFLEHMLFKGTDKRPNAVMISRDLDGVGADYNAFTSKDYTGYYIRLRADKLPFAVEMLDDMTNHSLIEQKEVDSERGVINEEIRMYEDNPTMLVDELLEELVFAGSTLWKKISGTPKSLEKISAKDLHEYRTKYYIPSKTIIAVAGKCEPEILLPLLEKTFGTIKEPKKKPTPFTPHKFTGHKPQLHIQEKPTEQIQLALGFPAFGYTHKDLQTLGVMATLLGGPMSSRLFVEVRERRGLAYSIRASSSPYADTGAFVVQAGLAKERVHEAFEVIIKELTQLKTKLVPEDELERTKEYLKGKLALNFEDSSNIADWYGRKMLLTGEIRTPEQHIGLIEKVTAKDIVRIAKQILVANKASIAGIGAFPNKEKLLTLLKKL